jgi:hypothetical protein
MRDLVAVQACWTIKKKEKKWLFLTPKWQTKTGTSSELMAANLIEEHITLLLFIQNKCTFSEAKTSVKGK